MIRNPEHIEQDIENLELDLENGYITEDEYINQMRELNLDISETEKDFRDYPDKYL